MYIKKEKKLVGIYSQGNVRKRKRKSRSSIGIKNQPFEFVLYVIFSKFNSNSMGTFSNKNPNNCFLVVHLFLHFPWFVLCVYIHILFLVIVAAAVVRVL